MIRLVKENQKPKTKNEGKIEKVEKKENKI